MNKPFICNCGVKKGKHKRDHWCDVWEATGPDENLYEWEERYYLNDGRTEADDYADSPTRGQADQINRENAR